MKLTLIEATGQPTNSWLRINAATGQIESHKDEEWTPTGWRVNLLTEELELLNGDIYVATGLRYSEETSLFSAASNAPEQLQSDILSKESNNLAPLTQWLRKSHNALFAVSIVFLIYAFFGFRAEREESAAPLWPIIASSCVVLVAIYLVWRRSSLRAALLFMIAVSVTRGMWFSKVFQIAKGDHVAENQLQRHIEKPDSKEYPSERLCDFIRDRDHVGVEEILARGADANSVLTDGSGQTALHLASSLGDTEIVRMLIAKKARINASDAQGKTALHYAAESGSATVVKLLLSEGADSTIKANSGWTAHEWVASMQGETGEIAQILNESQKLASFSAIETKSSNAPDTKLMKSLVDSINVTVNEQEIAIWRLNNRIIFEAPNQFYGDATSGEISPDGCYVQFGSAKINTDRRSPHVFEMKENSLTHFGDVTDLVIEAVNTSGILPAGCRLDDGCYVDIVKWTKDSELLLNAYCRQRNPRGFEITNFPAVWNLRKNKISYAPGALPDNAAVKFFDENSKVSKMDSSDAPDKGNLNAAQVGTKSYTGKVGALAAEFELTWLPNSQLAGTYFYPTRNPSLKYKLVGNGDVQSGLTLQEFTNEKLTATIRMKNLKQASQSTWTGIMHNADGRNLEVLMTEVNKIAWVFADSSQRLLTANELRALSRDQLWRARNEIYARNGLIFSTEKGRALVEVIGNQYKGTEINSDIVHARMNEVEKANIENIKGFER